MAEGVHYSDLFNPLTAEEVRSEALRELKQELHYGLDEGTTCRLCGKYARKYWRRFNSSMAKSLIWLCGRSGWGRDWVDVPNEAPKWLTRTNQLPTCRWWQLCERRPEDPEGKNKHSGIWSPTQRGLWFVTGQQEIPEKVQTYNGKPINYTLETVSIYEVLDSDGFDYKELMREYGLE